MKRPRPLTADSSEEPGYPRLDELTPSRRAFLRRVVLSGLAAGMGGRLIVACSGDGGAASGKVLGPDAHGWGDSGTNQLPRHVQDAGPAGDAADGAPSPWQDVPIERHLGEYVRLPAEGWEYAYWDLGGYDGWGETVDLRFAVSFYIDDAAFAAYYRANPQVGLDLAQQLMQGGDCDQLSDPQVLQEVAKQLGFSLDDAYTDATGEQLTVWYQDLMLIVDSCYQGEWAGGFGDPDSW